MVGKFGIRNGGRMREWVVRRRRGRVNWRRTWGSEVLRIDWKGQIADCYEISKN